MTHVTSTLGAFLKFVADKERNRAHDSVHLWRGQVQADWPLQSTLGRAISRENWPEGCGMQEWVLLRDFMLRGRQFLQRPPTNLWEWMGLARHHGVPFRLMDWTRQATTALAFALGGPDDPVEGSASRIWLLEVDARSVMTADGLTAKLREWMGKVGCEPDGSYEADGPTDPHQLCHWNELRQLDGEVPVADDDRPEVFVMQPPLTLPRLAAQQALFTVFADPQSAWTAETRLRGVRDLDFVDIPDGAQRELRGELWSLLGLTHEQLFPGLDGLGTHLRHRAESWLL